MPQLAAALSITKMMNPHLFFLLLTGDFLVDHLYLEEESLPPNWIMGSGRRAEEEEEGGR